MGHEKRQVAQGGHSTAGQEVAAEPGGDERQFNRFYPPWN